MPLWQGASELKVN